MADSRVIYSWLCSSTWSTHGWSWDPPKRLHSYCCYCRSVHGVKWSCLTEGPHWSSESHTAALCLPQVARDHTPGPPPLGLNSVQWGTCTQWCPALCSSDVFMCTCRRCHCVWRAMTSPTCIGQEWGQIPHTPLQSFGNQGYFCQCPQWLSCFNRAALYAGWVRSDHTGEKRYLHQYTWPHSCFSLRGTC